MKMKMISLTIDEYIMNEESKIIRFKMKKEIIETDQVKERKGTVNTVNILVTSPVNNALSYSSERVARNIITHIVQLAHINLFERKMNELCAYERAIVT